MRHREHLVQFFDAEPEVWANSVGPYFAEGLKQGDALLVIATPAHRAAIAGQLGRDPELAESSGRLVFRDARGTLDRFMVNGEPDWEEFRRAVEGEMERLLPIGLVRAYDDMVGILWSARQFCAATRLEEYWNRLLQSNPAALLLGALSDLPSMDASKTAALSRRQAQTVG